MADTPRSVDPAARAVARASADKVKARAAAMRARFAPLAAAQAPSPVRAIPEPAPQAPATAPAASVEPVASLSAIPESRPAPQETVMPEPTPVGRAQRDDQILIDATGLPDDNRLGPLAFDLRAGAALPAGCDGRAWSICWPPSVGWWTTAFPPARGQTVPDGCVRLPAIAPEKVAGRWARLAGWTKGGREDAAWVIALDESGVPISVWATSPNRGALLAAAVAGPGYRIPDEPVWTLTADGQGSPADGQPSAPEDPSGETYVDAW